MPITDHRIHDLQSFQSVTADPRQVAGLIFYKYLDPLCTLAHKLSIDFFKRPHHYVDVGQLAPALANLWAQNGSEVDKPSKDQRHAIYGPIFGESDDSSQGQPSDYVNLSNELIQAAAAFVERSADDGLNALREQVKDAHRKLRNYLLGLHGASANLSKEDILDEFTQGTVYPLITSVQIAAIFGISADATTNYPFDPDPNREKVVEEISKELMWVDAAQSYITRQEILDLQRAATRGAEAIATALDFDEADPSQNDQDLDLLISKWYTAGNAYRSAQRQKAAASGPKPIPATSTIARPAPYSLRYSGT